MKSIKEEALEHSLEPRANAHCGYDEEDLENSFEAGAKYVLEEIEKTYDKEGLVGVLDLIEQLKK